MAKCIEKYICDSTTDDCYVVITDENGVEIDTRFLHDGDEIYLNVPDRVGYTFTGFVDEDGNRLELEEYAPGMYRAEAVCGGSFIATYETNLYEVNVTICDAVDGGTVSGSGSYRYNTNADINVTENDGFHFVGWRIDGEIVSTDMNYTFTVKGDTDICAFFEVDECSIVAKPNNRNLGMASGTGIYPMGATVTLTATPLDGSYFVSWDDGSTDATRQVVVNGNKVYVAIFARHRYRVTVIIVNDSQTRPDEECGIVLGDGEYEYGSVVTLREIPNAGFAFKSWEVMGSVVGTGNTHSFAINGDITIVARFDDAMFELVLYVSPAGGGITTNGISSYPYTGGTYPYGTVVEALAIPNSLYVFDRWGDGVTDARHSFTMTRDITQTAYFVMRNIQYTLKINCDEIKGNVKIYDTNNREVQIIGSGYVYVTVDSGTVLTAVVTENRGYRFSEWDDSDTRYVRSFVVNNDIERTVLFEEEAPFTICLCTSFNFNVGYVEITMVDGTRIGVMDSYETRCIQVDQGTEIRAIYHVLDENYMLDNWNITDVSVVVIDQNTVQYTPIGDMELCPDVEYIEPFVPRVYINIDMLDKCKEEKTCDDMRGMYADWVYIVGNETDDHRSSLSYFPPVRYVDCDTLSVEYKEITSIDVGDSVTLYPKTTGSTNLRFVHWEINTNGVVTQTNVIPLTVTKTEIDTIHVTAFYDCEEAACTSTFTIKDANVKVEYNGVTYNYNYGDSVSVDTSSGSLLTFSSVNISEYMWKAFDVTNPLNPIDVVEIASTTPSGSFCYEPFPQTDSNGYYTFYAYTLMNYFKFGPGGEDYDYNNPDYLKLYVRLTTDTNYVSSQLYIDPSTVTWIENDADPNRNSFDTGQGYNLPFNDSRYLFNSTYYRYKWKNVWYYLKKIQVNLNNVPTFNSTPTVASMRNTPLSPYLIKVPCPGCTPPQKSTITFNGNGYYILCVLHENCAVFNPWEEICYPPYNCGAAPSQFITNPSVNDPDYISDKGSNTTYHKRTNYITFKPECGHSYEFCGMDADFNIPDTMYVFLGSADSDAAAEAMGYIPTGATVTLISPPSGSDRYESAGQLEYLHPASSYSINAYVKAKLHDNGLAYYQVRSVCQ